jgi:hypothetical protein
MSNCLINNTCTRSKNKHEIFWISSFMLLKRLKVKNRGFSLNLFLFKDFVLSSLTSTCKALYDEPVLIFFFFNDVSFQVSNIIVN